MRVSKVNVKVDGKDTMVLMHRSTEKGALVYAEQNDTDRTREIIPEKKQDSFKLSMVNKTVVRFESLNTNRLSRDEKAAIKTKHKNIESIFKRNELPPSIKSEDILPYLNHKFHFPVKYCKDGKWYQFILSECIEKAVARQNKNELQPYYDWKKWYVADKSDRLRHSIAQNKIETGDGDSKKQQALLLWEPDFVAAGRLNLDDFHRSYNTDGLVAELCRVPMGELRSDGTARDTNAYHRNLKRALQTHQATVFGKREAPNEANRENKQLAIYHLEVVKYLEHYFPIKKSGRRNTADDIAYYLKSATLKTTLAYQLENAVRANLLRKGKYQRHNLQGETTSRNLIDLKRNEAFALNLISTSAFAANNIRNIIDPTQTEDILGSKNFKISLAKNTINAHAFRLFFPTDVASVDLKTLWAMRGAVQKVRNEVAHYKTDTLNKIFDVKEFEYPATGNTAFSDTIFAGIFAAELNKLPEAFALQLKSGGVLSYYSVEQLTALLGQVEFQLCRTVVPFAPGFKKVMKEGLGKQNAKQDDLFYDLQIKAFKPKDEFSEEAWSARYFLLKTIYNYLFLPVFMDDVALFSAAVNRVLEINKAQAQKLQNTNAFAFADVRPMKAAETITDYMAYVQSQWMQEQTKKEEGVADETRINFEKFVLQLFVKGFDTFLSDPKFAFAQVPQPQIQLTDSNQQQADRLNELEASIRPLCRISRQYINPARDEQIAFYVYCKLLDANYLSMLRNEMIKFRQSSEEEGLHHQLEIIELCLLGVDAVPTNYKEIYPNSGECLDRLRPFVAEGVDFSQWGDLYVQTDKETPVVHAGIELTIKYGTANLLQQLIASEDAFKISDKNFDRWYNLKKEIAEKMNVHTQYHQEWVAAKEKDDEERRKKVYKKSNFAAAFIKQKGVDYINNCTEINNYNWLDNKLHFNNLKRLQNLTVEILGRMAGFVTLWERDFQYFDQQRVKQFGGNLLDFSHGVPKKNELEPHEAYFKKMLLCDDYRATRNHIAHFNYLTQSAAKYSLIELINRLRELLHYDRKLKNAVAGAFIDLFDKHGMALKLTFDNSTHQLAVESITPKKIYHLGTKERGKEPLFTNQVQTGYCKLCKALLELKK